MRIKRLELVGFKSCMDRTVLHFPAGVTGIVGPNGCGKSNIVDALRWVLGEQSAKHLRGQAMGDVIFAGNERFGPLGVAEVSVVFDNEEPDQQWLGALEDADESDAGEEAPSVVSLLKDVPEVEVTRRLYRSGESEYLINGRICRLRDITELFLGTGVGRQAYSIIEQGKVGHIVGAKPEELRLLIEEAAGTTLYRSRKLAAERKIERTRDNLLRVNDIVRELERQANSLRRQARGAIRYKELRAQEAVLDERIAAYRIRSLRGRMADLKQQLASALEAEDGVRRSSVEASQERERLRALLREHSDGVEAARAAMYEARSRLAKLEQEKRFLADRIEELTRLVGEAHEEVSTLDLKLAEARAKEAEAEKERDETAVGLRRSADERTLAEFELAEATRTLAGRTTELEQIKSELIEHLSADAASRNEIQSTTAQVSTGEARIARLQEELATLEHGIADARGNLARAETSVGRVVGEIEETAGGKESVAARLRELLQRRSEAERHVAEAREALSTFRSRYESLHEVQESFTGYDDGVRSFMKNGGRELTGAEAVLADVIDIERGFERAVAAVLDDRLQHVIVASPDAGVVGAEYLREAGTGRVSFVPLEPRIKRGEVHEGEALLLDHVRAREGYESVISALLDTVVLVDNLEDATSRWKANGSELTFVTVDGEVVDSCGTVTGGSGRPGDEAILTRKAELSSLLEAVAGAEQRVQQTSKDFREVREAADRAGTTLGDLDKRLHELTVCRVTCEGEVELWRQNLLRTEERFISLRAELDALVGESGERRSRLASLQEALEQAARAREELERRQLHQQAERERAEQHRNLTAQRLEAVKVYEAEQRQRRESCERTVGVVRAARADIEGRVADLRRRLARDERDLAACRERLALPELDLEALGAVVRGHEGALEDADRRSREVQRQLDAAEARSDRLSGELEVVRERRSGLDLACKESQLEEQSVASGLRERAGVSADELLRRVPAEVHLQVDEVSTELEGIRERIRRLGTVNIGAVSELEEIDARLAELTRQRDDLDRSIEDLRGTIAKLNKLSRRRFKETFDEVDRIFRETFPRLFPGGTASLALSDEANLLETGVEIFVQPPGKKLGNLNLLSGGEKALTAVSLIFSLFLYKPSPFCVLDEVDAPLDDANIGRFTKMVADMSSRSQFVIITHNKRTMESCNTLYGVTMSQPGVSRIVSVDLAAA